MVTVLIVLLNTGNIMNLSNPLPLEQVDPELAEHFRLIANKEHPTVKIVFGNMQGMAIVTHKGQIKRISTERNEECLCGSGIKFKKCHGKP